MRGVARGRALHIKTCALREKYSSGRGIGRKRGGGIRLYGARTLDREQKMMGRTAELLGPTADLLGMEQ